MGKQQLIAKIIAEVKDERLRDELLRAISREDMESRDSAVLRELASLGLNPEGAKEYMAFYAKFNVYGGYVVSTIFLILGVGMLFTEIWPMGVFFIGVGIFALCNTKKLHKVVKR